MDALSVCVLLREIAQSQNQPDGQSRQDQNSKKHMMYLMVKMQ